MGDKTNIAWTDSTWNVTRGCTRVSPGCEHCYAERVAARFSGEGQPYEGLAAQVNGHARWSNTVATVPQALDLPYRWKTPRKIFVDSMSDLFHADVPTAFIFAVFTVIEATPQHTYQVLTKRPERMHAAVTNWLVHQGRSRPAPNLWLGVSVEDQQRAEERIPVLLETPAAVRFISAEPLLGPLDLRPWLTRVTARYPGDDSVAITEYETLGWVIAGGESGPGARPMHPDWVRSIRDQCVAAGVALFFKQWGEWTPRHPVLPPAPRGLVSEGTDAEMVVYRLGKHRAGRELDGRTWDEFPRRAVRDAT